MALLCMFALSNYMAVIAAQSAKTPIAEINSYAAQVDSYIKRHARGKRIFGDVSSYNDNAPRWREFKNESEAEKHELYSTAYVWSRDANIVGVNLTLSSPSGDWAHYVTYYFRKDGSLAKIEAQLNTFYGDVSVVRQQYFDNRGVRLRTTRRVLDLKTKKPKKSADYMDQDVPVYRKLSELPFSKLL